MSPAPEGYVDLNVPVQTGVGPQGRVEVVELKLCTTCGCLVGWPNVHREKCEAQP